jgi:hypothetical protein
MRRLLNLRTSFIAVTTILAMLVVPGCGSLCAAMTHCSTSTASANSDSESCHHTGMSAQSDSETQSLSSETSCGQQSPLVAILTGSDSSVRIEFFEAANALPSITIPTRAVLLNDHRDVFSPPNESRQQSIPLENLSVLRI